ncbi:hypothetical protein N7516_005497 [Penicillium verrucosum]|uniref:uncharacterized protein n=1 Tax=Penicillium verrucosum TaxID=60171 RepID=UPI00254509A4|nr:uncharacterized protein N7516_005497 [Penicillium verrucosum]KAJ5945329.1 hypothetical protein N7516_005497 [Penicillium verrucosum]
MDESWRTSKSLVNSTGLLRDIELTALTQSLLFSLSASNPHDEVRKVSFPCHGQTGHPAVHEPTSNNALTKKSFLHNGKRCLNLCADYLERRGVNASAEAHRAATVAKHHKRGMIARDTDKVVNTSHRSSLNVTPNTSESEMFSKSPVCILTPEGEVALFWVKGELVHSVMFGTDLYWDTWNGNSTGVYSGVQSSLNGNGDDATNLDKTSPRGI